jgi:ABC-type nitrate/sulfonate/bicarbonate transport system substrate-binding protein
MDVFYTTGGRMNDTQTRREFIAKGSMLAGGIAGANVLAACGSSSSSSSASSASGSSSGSLKKVTVGLDWVTDVEYSGYYIGIERGYYAAEGIDFHFDPGGPNAPKVTQMVASGAADIGIATDLLVLFDTIKQGTPLVLLAAKFQQSPEGVASLASKPIRTAADIVGKKIGGPQGDQRFFDAVLAVNHLPKNYTFVPTGFDIAPLAHGDVDGLSVFVNNQPIDLQLQGVNVVAVTLAQMGLASYADMIFATKSYVQNNRDLVVRFLRATIKGWEADMRNPHLGTQLTINKYGKGLGLGSKHEYLELLTTIKLMQSPLTQQKGIFWISPTALGGPMYAAVRATGRTDLPPVSGFLDLGPLTDAYAGKTTI